MTTDGTDGELLALVREAIAEHLDVPQDGVTAQLTLGDLALDSLDVLAVVDRAGKRGGRRLTLDYRDAEHADRLGDLHTLTVADFAECLIPE